MLEQIKNRTQQLLPYQWLILAFGLLCVLSVWLAVATEKYYLAALPLLVLVLFQTIFDFKPLFYLLLASLPISTEIVLPNGFGTDLPSEPLMIGLMLVGIIYYFHHNRELNNRLLLHPITLLLLVHLFWIYLTSITSNLFFVSLKFSLAKTWYVIVFYFMAAWILKNLEEQKKLFWLIFLPLLFSVVVIMIRHSASGFSFVGIHKVLHPFQRNHVNYAAMLVLVYPMLWFAWRRQESYSRLWYFLGGCLVFFLLAVYLSFTRAAYIALVIAVGAYFVFQWKLIKPLIVVACLGAVMALTYMVQKNRYLEYAPNYDKTVTHFEFDNLVEATYKLEDISTMERLYRWVAGFRMSPEEPWVGFGPGNFVNFYRSYTLTSFKTYVSGNKEKSGIHSYYIMTLVEQGIIGLLIFLALSFYLLIKGEKIYHETKDKVRKGIVMSALLGLVILDTLLLINDLIETDKCGPFFFLFAVILVNIDFHNKDLKKASQPQSQVKPG